MSRLRSTLPTRALMVALLLTVVGCAAAASRVAPTNAGVANAATANEATAGAYDARGTDEIPRSPAEVARLDGGQPPYTAADVVFMQGMIPHHAQAVQMAKLAPTRASARSVQILAERIAVAQRDEVAFMQRWLGERGHAVPIPDSVDAHSEHAGHDAGMPGMLSAAEMAQLQAARGSAFDRLFLTFMIKHHQGALVMVDRLLGSEGAAQDDEVYRFVADVNADQDTEIARMSRLLDELPETIR